MGRGLIEANCCANRLRLGLGCASMTSATRTEFDSKDYSIFHSNETHWMLGSNGLRDKVNEISSKIEQLFSPYDK